MAHAVAAGAGVENGVYAVFSNAVGVDDDPIKPGLAMILDPFGEIVAESRAPDDDVVVTLLTADKLAESSARDLRARWPALYGKLVERCLPVRSGPNLERAFHCGSPAVRDLQGRTEKRTHQARFPQSNRRPDPMLHDNKSAGELYRRTPSWAWAHPRGLLEPIIYYRRAMVG